MLIKERVGRYIVSNKDDFDDEVTDFRNLDLDLDLDLLKIEQFTGMIYWDNSNRKHDESMTTRKFLIPPVRSYGVHFWSSSFFWLSVCSQYRVCIRPK